MNFGGVYIHILTDASQNQISYVQYNLTFFCFLIEMFSCRLTIRSFPTQAILRFSDLTIYCVHLDCKLFRLGLTVSNTGLWFKLCSVLSVTNDSDHIGLLGAQRKSLMFPLLMAKTSQQRNINLWNRTFPPYKNTELICLAFSMYIYRGTNK